MSRMIDADKCPCIKCWNGNLTNISCNTSDCMFFRRWLETTAYDVDKVVEELETAPYFHGECGHIETDEAIDIVKRGGVDEIN